ncbi:hypothetical protein GCM10027346_42680 [Hymenobacter seoulensis]
MNALPEYPCRLRLRKLAALPGHATGAVPVGACYVGDAVAPPQPTQRFWLLRRETGRWLSTSSVQRLLNAHTFITRNSVYRIEFFKEVECLPHLRARRQRRSLRQVHRPNEEAAVEPRP